MLCDHVSSTKMIRALIFLLNQKSSLSRIKIFVHFLISRVVIISSHCTKKSSRSFSSRRRISYFLICIRRSYTSISWTSWVSFVLRFSYSFQRLSSSMTNDGFSNWWFWTERKRMISRSRRCLSSRSNQISSCNKVIVSYNEAIFENFVRESNIFDNSFRHIVKRRHTYTFCLINFDRLRLINQNCHWIEFDNALQASNRESSCDMSDRSHSLMTKHHASLISHERYFWDVSRHEEMEGTIHAKYDGLATSWSLCDITYIRRRKELEK